MKNLLATVGLLLLALVATPLSGAEQHPASAVTHEAGKASPEVSHPAEEHGAGHSAPKTYFGIPGWILKMANLIVFIAALAYLLKGPVGKAFRERSELIRTQLSEARARQTKADQFAADIEARLQQIEKEVATILERATEEGERQKQELLAAAEADARKVVTSARAEVENRVKLARKELAEYAGELAVSRAHSLLEKSLTDADRQKLFDESVSEMSGGKKG